MKRTLDKALAEPTYKRIIERGPWASYARCDECGVDADHTCPTCCIDIDASDAISGLKFWSKP